VVFSSFRRCRLAAGDPQSLARFRCLLVLVNASLYSVGLIITIFLKFVKGQKGESAISKCERLDRFYVDNNARNDTKKGRVQDTDPMPNAKPVRSETKFARWQGLDRRAKQVYNGRVKVLCEG
jgi:hypothetical protein